MQESWCGPAHRGLLLVAFGFIALLGAQLLLVTSIPGTNYDGADGMAAQAEILTTMEFARPFEITNLNPLQGLWPQMMPMNVWVNPAYWPVAFFHKELAADVSGTGAIAGYWGGLEALAADARRWTHVADRAGRGAGLRRVRLPSLPSAQAARRRSWL